MPLQTNKLLLLFSITLCLSVTDFYNQCLTQLPYYIKDMYYHYYFNSNYQIYIIYLFLNQVIRYLHIPTLNKNYIINIKV